MSRYNSSLTSPVQQNVHKRFHHDIVGSIFWLWMSWHVEKIANPNKFPFGVLLVGTKGVIYCYYIKLTQRTDVLVLCEPNFWQDVKLQRHNVCAIQVSHSQRVEGSWWKDLLQEIGLGVFCFQGLDTHLPLAMWWYGPFWLNIILLYIPT